MQIIEAQGRIKWFDASMGYGFIAREHGEPDILLHVNPLRYGGFETAHEGASITVEAVQGDLGLKTCRVLSMDESTAIIPAHRPHRTHVIVVPETGWRAYRTKWFNRSRGFGFLTLDDGSPDVFIHIETLRRHSFTELRVDQIVDARVGLGERGWMVADIRSRHRQVNHA